MLNDVNSPAQTPPMGWNSWDCYGTTVTEEEVLANARKMADVLLPNGWDTVVVDIAWYDPLAKSHGYNEHPQITMDQWGRQLPAENRFPSSAGGRGFLPLAEQIHALGLKFGVHLMRGIPKKAVAEETVVWGTQWTAKDAADTSSTCPWNPDNYGLNFDHPAAQAYVNGQIAQLASWGIDYLKVDDMLFPYHRRAIEALKQAVDHCGRQITISLSPGTNASTMHVEHLGKQAHLWRISDDLWDRWEDIHAQFARLARWAPFQRPGAWADADMLPVGRIGLRAERGEPRHSRLSIEEQKTMLSLWCMARSPLMIGGDLPSSSEQTLELLAHPAIREVLCNSRNGRELLREPLEAGELIIWYADSTTDELAYLSLFWTGESAYEAHIHLESLIGFPSEAFAFRDLWTGSDTLKKEGQMLHISMARHSVTWLELRFFGQYGSP